MIRFSLLQVEPIIPSTLELQKLEYLDTRKTCLITIPQNHFFLKNILIFSKIKFRAYGIGYRIYM
jgi:hypothetical protein